ncbi:MAG: hypothetical protein GY742_01035 [Hyphomicrobiales bacterium]|nr:hypothetical protein [Hyphomicrobiales bacterium]
MRCARVLLAVIFLQALPALAAETRGQFHLKDNGDYFGFDLLTERDVSLDQCKASCLKNLGCVAFTYNKSAKFCFLKSDFGQFKPFEGAIAGRIINSNNEPDIGAPPKLTFVPEYIRERAEKFRAGILANSNQLGDLGFVALTQIADQRMDGREFGAAMANIMAALRIDPDHQQSWIMLSDAAHAIPSQDSSQKRRYRKTATSAAINGYLLSRTKISRAEALASLARGLEALQQFRPALTAYQKSLDLNEVPSERYAFLELRRTHGFRVLNHTIDSDNLSPRICVQFSEKLKTKTTGYEDFLSVNNSSPKSVDVKGKQICIEGLEHGRSYKIALRQGLPSAIQENLQSDINLNVYVRDRSAAVRFTGSNFVLPSMARRTIPLVTVNTDGAKLKIFRVGERALTTLLRNSQFLQQLDEYSVEYLVDDLGEPVWNGSIDIRSELNKEVITSIPVDEALAQRKSGIYLMTATPAITKPDEYGVRATQWFLVSDIGLTTFSGNRKMQVFTRSLSKAISIEGVELTLIARNNEVLGKARSDAQGQAIFDAGLLRGKGGLAPAIIIAKNGADDFVFLDLSKPGFDFSDRGVTGRAVAKDVDVYAWSERGIYRAGETVYSSALARDNSANAIDDLPLTFVFTRPDGVEERRIVDNGAALGGYNVELPLTHNAKRGTWNMQVYTDPKSDPVAEHRFLVEDFLPEKTDFTLVPVHDTITIGQTAAVNVKGRYLYGAPAAGLSLEGEIIVRTKRSRKGYQGYLFGLAASDEGSAQHFPIDNMSPLNSEGEGSFDILLDKAPATTRMQSAQVIVRMREGSGRSVERQTEIDVVAPDTMIGIKAQFENGQIAENSDAGFEIIAVDRDGKKTALPGTSWSLVKIERNYQWYRNGSSWHYESVDIESKIADGIIDISADNLSKLSMPVEWGKYRLDMETSSVGGPATSVEFNAGWFVNSQSTQTPDGLEIALDKRNYKAGEIAKLKISPRFAGEMLIAIGTDHIVEHQTVSIPAEGTIVDIEVKDDWGAGAYILATLYRPGEAGKSRMPARAIGVKWLGVEPEKRALDISLKVPEKIQPHETLSIPVSVSGLAPGEEAYVNVAVVDVGILNLTNYQSPDPVERYFGQRKLGIAMRDIYGRLIDGSQGVIGKLRTGGDGPDELDSSGEPPTGKLVAFYSGQVRVDENGNAKVEFDIPQFNGTARVMATAWSAEALGAAQSEVIIRDPVVISASLPKFLAPGDETRMLVEITNTDAVAGEFDVEYTFSENLGSDGKDLIDNIELVAGDARTIAVPVTAGTAGEAWARIALSGVDGVYVTHEIAVNIRSGILPVTRKLKARLIANNGSLNIDRNLLEGNLLEGAKVNISVALENSIEVPSLLLRLNRYPYGCAEQITSKALPLLYLSEFPARLSGEENEKVESRVQVAINTVLSYQSSSGGFSLWGTESDDLWLSAYVTDFLTRANEKGYKVPRQSLRQSLQNLQNVLAYQNNLDENDEAIAYTLYVLARNRVASAGDLRYYVDTQLQEFKTPIARAQLAAGMALYGDRLRADQTFNSAFQLALSDADPDSIRYSYGSRLRDAAAMLALAGESNSSVANLADMNRLVASLYFVDSYTSTQEQAWMLLAARASKKSSDRILLDINGLPHSGAYSQRLDGGELADDPIVLKNRYDEDLQVIVTTVAVPDEAPVAGGEGFSIERTYYRLDGSEANVSEVSQNERFVVVLNVSQLRDLPSRLIISDLLPAGFEIDNPRLVKSADLANFKWLPKVNSVYSEFLNDRFVTAFNRSKGGKKDFTVAYMVRAVTPGTYMHPAASVEDMYRPQLSARTATGWMRVVKPR